MSYSVLLPNEDLLIVQMKKKTERNAKFLRRYQCLSMLHDKYAKKDIAHILGVNLDTITDWIKIYNKSGLSGLGLLHYEGRRPSALDEHKEELILLVKKKNISTLYELQSIIKQQYDLVAEHSWLSRYCKKNSISLIKRHG